MGTVARGRRRFLACATLATVGARCGGSSVTLPEGDDGTVRLPLMQVGTTIPVSVTHRGRFLDLAVTRLDSSTLAALSRECTHQGCLVGLPEAPGLTMNCPCHGSRFRADGTLVQGPADRPLRSYPARIEGDQAVVALS